MNAHLTVRVTETLNAQLHILAKKKNLKTSDLVRLALEKYLNESKAKEDSTPYSRTKNLLGSIETGISDLGENHRTHLLKKFKVK
jgi:antitoxin component of RelBE/YafQ-DinJ toxin-antitoxin module